MDKRTFIKTLVGLMTATAIPRPLLAKTIMGNQEAFLAALAEKPWLLGYLGTQETELQASLKILSGAVPEGLKGSLYRNGPAMHTVGNDRFSHWFDAPGMVQRFRFSDQGVSHYGRLIETTRNVREASEGKILFNGFGTHGHDLSTGGSADGQSTGNISLIKHDDELLALWEGGSPHIIDPESLETKGLKAWSDETQGLPFGAHPRGDKDGSLWNIGYSSNPGALIIYHISEDGQLLNTHMLRQEAAPMVHDFMITDTKIIIVAAPLRSMEDGGDTFIDSFAWQPNDPTEIIVLDKSDLSNVKIVEVDPFWAFHFGNAYDISDTEVGFDLAHYDDPGLMTKDSFAMMDGSWDGVTSSPSRYVQARVNLANNSVSLEHSTEFGQAEFIQTNPMEDLNNHKHTVFLSQPAGPERYGFNQIVLMDRTSGDASTFMVGETELLEEHLMIPKPDKPGDFWIVGTSLDWAKGVTNLSIYEGLSLSDGPVMKAELDLALPLGLHGTFIPA